MSTLPKDWPSYIAKLVRLYDGEYRLAQALDVDIQRISGWLRGREPSQKYVRHVADRLQEPLPLLFCVAYQIPVTEMDANHGGVRLTRQAREESPAAQAVSDGHTRVPRAWR